MAKEFLGTAPSAATDLATKQYADTEAATFRAEAMIYVGTNAAPVTLASQARPAVDGPVYWLCANGVTPTNAIVGDLIFNKDA